MKFEQPAKRRYRFPVREKAREFAREFAGEMIPDADGSHWVYVVFAKAWGADDADKAAKELGSDRAEWTTLKYGV